MSKTASELQFCYNFSHLKTALRFTVIHIKITQIEDCSNPAKKPSTKLVVPTNLEQVFWQLVANMTEISDLLQGSPNHSDTDLL